MIRTCIQCRCPRYHECKYNPKWYSWTQRDNADRFYRDYGPNGCEEFVKIEKGAISCQQEA